MGFGAAEANSASTPVVPSMKSGGRTLSPSALPTTMVQRIRADSALSDVSNHENDERGRVDSAQSDMSIPSETSHGEIPCRQSVWRDIKDRMAKIHPSTDGLCSPISISELSIAPFVDAAPPRVHGDPALDDDSEIVTPKTPQTPWLNPQFKMGQEFTVDHGREQDTQDDPGQPDDPFVRESSYDCLAAVEPTSSLTAAELELDMLKGQAQQLRATIARRKHVKGVNGSGDDVHSIVVHYERVLDELQLRIVELTLCIHSHEDAEARQKVQCTTGENEDSDSGRSTDCASQGFDEYSNGSLSARSGDDESLPEIWTC